MLSKLMETKREHSGSRCHLNPRYPPTAGLRPAVIAVPEGELIPDAGVGEVDLAEFADDATSPSDADPVDAAEVAGDTWDAAEEEDLEDPLSGLKKATSVRSCNWRRRHTAKCLLCACSLFITGNRQDAEDALQEAGVEPSV